MSNYTAVLLDIEGTTTPAGFAEKTLVPYARARIAKYVADFATEAQIAAIERDRETDVRRNQNPPGDFEDDPRKAAAEYLSWQIDRDRKSNTLREIQAEICIEGFEDGDLRGEVFPDVAAKLREWKKKGTPVYMFSSGTVESQKQLFSTVEGDDLTRFIAGYFDTTTGPKKEAGSYAEIAESIHRQPGEILFVSDVTAELDAAAVVGYQTRHSIRPGNKETKGKYPALNSFEELT